MLLWPQTQIINTAVPSCVKLHKRCRWNKHIVPAVVWRIHVFNLLHRKKRKTKKTLTVDTLLWAAHSSPWAKINSFHFLCENSSIFPLQMKKNLPGVLFWLAISMISAIVHYDGSIKLSPSFSQRTLKHTPHTPGVRTTFSLCPCSIQRCPAVPTDRWGRYRAWAAPSSSLTYSPFAHQLPGSLHTVCANRATQELIICSWMNEWYFKSQKCGLCGAEPG